MNKLHAIPYHIKSYHSIPCNSINSLYSPYYTLPYHAIEMKWRKECVSTKHKPTFCSPSSSVLTSPINDFFLKLKTIHKYFLWSYKRQIYASLHSNFHEHLWSNDAVKACNMEAILQKLTNILRRHVLVLNIAMVWHDLFVSQV